MRITYLLKYSGILMLLILIMFLILSLFTYFFDYNKIVEYGYSFVAPVCIFIISLLYAKKTKEKGLLRGLEVWAIYFVLICILRYTALQGTDVNIFKHLIFIPVSIVGGILGVNLHK